MQCWQSSRKGSFRLWNTRKGTDKFFRWEIAYRKSGAVLKGVIGCY